MNKSYRIPSITVTQEEPFAHDALNRKPIVDFVANILSETDGQPLVLAIDSPYGTGKSTFIEMLQSIMRQKSFQVVNFNAWKADHVSDPLIAMVAALDQAFPNNSMIVPDKMARVKKVAGIMLKHSAAVGLKIATAGILEMPDNIEEALADTASSATSDIIGSFENEEKAAKCFKEELEKLIAKLPQMGKKDTLVFFIDELDRCRPDFAMSLLERIKHLFDVPNIAFVLAVDKKQLEAVTSSVYGEKIDAREYLRKFIDLEFGLPNPPKTEFLKNAMQRAGISTAFEGQRHNLQDQFIRFVSLLADVYGMSLRSIERCIVRLKVVIAVTPDDHTIHIFHVALLTVLRSIDKEVFDKIITGRIGGVEAMEYFRNLPGARGKFDDLDGNILEAILVADLESSEGIRDYKERQKQILNIGDVSEESRSNAQHKLQILESFTGGWSIRSRMRRVAATIDIAANIRE
ncbi:hypothetical protein IFT68_11965 [Oxalobacteraceae sp. CFBP 13730]|nr:hypothetical protein [Oxalobacteraceae sp. CFBP 13730]